MLFDNVSKGKLAGQVISLFAVLFFFLFVLAPLLFIFTTLGQFKYTDAMGSAIFISFFIGLVITVIDLLFGIPLAWFLTRRKFPFRDLIDALIDLPLIIPTSALGFSFVLFWGSTGLGLLSPGLGLVILLHVAFTMPYVIRTTQAAIVTVDADLPRAAKTLGASPFFSFRTVWLPLIRAGALSGAILAFTRSLGETGATMLAAGALQTVPILTVYYKNEVPSDMNAAISLSVVFLFLSCALFVLMRLFIGRKAFRLGKTNPPLEQRISKLYRVSDLAAMAFFLAVVLVPSFFFLKFTDFNLFNDSVISAIGISFAIAFGATILTIAFGLPLSMLIASHRTGSVSVRLLNDVALLIPTVTIGVSVGLFWSNRLDEPLVLLFTHVAIIFPYFVSSLSEVLAEMDKSLTEVARSLGATPFYAFRTITLPLIMPTFIAGALVAFMRSIAETGGTLAVSKNIVTIPILIVNLSKQGLNAQAASAALLLLVISVVAVFILRSIQKKRLR